MSKKGKVYLVGAGPGDPELLTLKAHRILSKSNVIIYDALVNPAILEFAPCDVIKVFIGKSRRSDRLSQKSVNNMMIDYAVKGCQVIRLKGGDPFIFGRGGEEMLALAEAEIAFEIIPGISAGHAVPAYADIPLTHRQIASSVTFVTGHECSGKNSSVNWKSLAFSADTLVVFMCVANLTHIVDCLIEAGKCPDTPIAVIEKGTLLSQKTRTGTLENIIEQTENNPVRKPALAVIGEVVRIREMLGDLKIETTVKERAIKTGVMDEVFSCVS
jgi:uroporphyrin-III C-methyltransferase